MDMLSKLQAVEDKYLELESMISDPSVLEDMTRWQRYNKEHSEMTPIVEAFREYKKVCQTIEDDKSMLEEGMDDDELRHMVEDELAEMRQRKEELDNELPVLLLPKDPNDDKNVIVEIRGGVGGDEAALFAGDLSACIPVMQRPRAGVWIFYLLMPLSWEASRKYPLLWRAMAPTAS